MSAKKRRLGKCTGLAISAALVWPSLMLNSGRGGSARQSAGQIGFEAAETSLKTRWRPEPGGYEVDRQEKHTGNQSIKLAATVAGVAKGASYCSPATRSRHRARSGRRLEQSGGRYWEKDDAYAIYIDVNYADGRTCTR